MTLSRMKSVIRARAIMNYIRIEYNKLYIHIIYSIYLSLVNPLPN